VKREADIPRPAPAAPAAPVPAAPAPSPEQHFAAMSESLERHLEQMCESLDRHLEQISKQLEAVCPRSTWFSPKMPTPNSILPTQPNGIPEALRFSTGKPGMQKGPI